MFSSIKPLHKLLVLLGILLLFSIFTAMGAGDKMDFDMLSPKMLMVMKLIQIIGVVFIFILPAFLYSMFFTDEKAAYLGITVKPKVSSLLISALVFVVGLPLISMLEHINKMLYLPESMAAIEDWMKQSEANAQKITELFLADTTVSGMLLNFFVIAFVAAVGEELFFRGALQNSLLEVVKNPHVAVWTAAILFSAFHMQFFGFIPRVLMGAVLGYLYLWSKSIWIPVFAHFVNNGLAVILIYLSNKGIIDKDIQNTSFTEQDWVVVLFSLFLLISAISAVYFIEKKQKA